MNDHDPAEQPKTEYEVSFVMTSNTENSTSTKNVP
jgi:hypothetical protein